MKKLGIFMADGCEEIEGLTVVDLVRRTGRLYITGPSPNRSGASCNLYFTGAV